MFNFILRWVFKIPHASSQQTNTVYLKVTVHFVCCVWNSLEQVLGSEGAAGGFVAGAYRHCVVVSSEKLMAAVLRTIHFFHEVFFRMFVIDDANYYINNCG